MLELIQLEHNSPEWLAFRQTGIGASEAAAVLGLSPFKTNVQVWEEKVGITVPEDISDKPQVAYGKAAEEFLVELFALDYPEYRVETDKSVVYRRGFMFASLDGELEDIATKELGILECKTTELHSRRQLANWDKQIPIYYYIQVLHQLITTGRQFVIVKAQIKILHSNGEVEIITRHYKYERKDHLEDMRMAYLKEKQFWEKYVLTKTRPPLILPNIGA